MAINLFNREENLIIGFDPGKKTTGIAIWKESESQFTELMTKEFWGAIEFIAELYESRKDNRNADHTLKGVTLFIENPNLNKPVFPMKEETEKFKRALSTNDYQLHNTTLKIFSRRAQNIGMNKQLATFFIEQCRRLRFRVKEVRPGKSKVNAEVFRSRTGYQGRTSQHSRDAGCLIYPI